MFTDTDDHIHHMMDGCDALDFHTSRTLLVYLGGAPCRLRGCGVGVVHALLRGRPAPLVLLRPQNGVVMSMQPRPWPDVPELTAKMARSSSRQGNLAMRIR